MDTTGAAASPGEQQNQDLPAHDDAVVASTTETQIDLTRTETPTPLAELEVVLVWLGIKSAARLLLPGPAMVATCGLFSAVGAMGLSTIIGSRDNHYTVGLVAGIAMGLTIIASTTWLAVYLAKRGSDGNRRPPK